MIAIKIIYAIAKCFEIYMYMILVRCLLTWFPGINWENPILKALRSSVDLYLDLFRKFIPPIGFIDISPIVAMLVQAYKDGIFTRVLTTNLVYQTPELLSRPYYINCDMSKYIALLIDTLNHDVSISDLLDPYDRIQALVKKYREHQPIS